MELETLRVLLQRSGVVGAGGAGFPTYGKLTDKADTVLLNCAECEPLLKLHQQLLAQHAPEILSALQMVAQAMGAQHVYVCAKSEYKSTTQALHESMGAYPDMRLELLDSIYPTGDEVILIYEVTGRVVRPGGLPLEVGVVVFNVETMYNIFCAVEQDAPVVSKLVTVTGEVETPITVRVPLGVALEEVVAMAGKTKLADPAYLVGGPMMGTLGNPKQPVTKTTNAILVLPQTHLLVLNRTSSASIGLKRAASACCQCESCTDMCPRHLLGHPIKPHLFMRAAANQDFRDINIFLDTMYCSGCGVCELYACPQSLSPRTLITTYKTNLRAKGIPVPKDAQGGEVAHRRAFRTIPEKRLQARVGLTQYDVPAPLDNRVRLAERVKVLMRQHIGAPAVPIVQKGAIVQCGEMIAQPGKGLSVAIHAPITGAVLEVNEGFIRIEAKE